MAIAAAAVLGVLTAWIERRYFRWRKDRPAACQQTCTCGRCE